MKKSEKKNSDAEQFEVVMDRRRGSRREPVAAVEPTTLATVPERRKKHRRRQIDPTTCERDYSHDEVEFMQAMDEYKRTSGRMFPTCSEVLEVIRALGYAKPESEEVVLVQSDESETATA